jgi:hypothetical protein
MYKSIQRFIEGNDPLAFDNLLGKKQAEKPPSGPKTAISKRQLLLHQIVQSMFCLKGILIFE